MSAKRFSVDDFIKTYHSHIIDKKKEIRTLEEYVNYLNELDEENKGLKQELKIYRKVASCSNCHYHNYDWFDDGDEFEVCDRGNDVTEGICKEWEELQ